MSVYIDLDAGMGRTGIPAGKAATRLYVACAGLPGIALLGLHLYDGHIRATALEVRELQCNSAFAGAEQMRAELTAMGYPEPIIIAGGSPTFPIHCKRQKVECSPGTFIYWDKGYLDTCPEQPFLPAALVITRVISLSGAHRLCLDLGHKSIAAENELSRRVFFLNAPGLMPISQSEEHLVVETAGAHTYKTGDVLYGLPYHICPTCALYESAFTVEEGQVTGEWKTIARCRRIGV